MFCCHAGDALEISVEGCRFGEAKHVGRFQYLTIKYLAFCFVGVTGSEYRHQDYDALPHLYHVGDEGAAFGVGDLDVLLTVLDGFQQWLLWFDFCHGLFIDSFE